MIGLAKSSLNGTTDTGAIRKRHYDVMRELGTKESLIQKELEELEILLQGISLLKELTPRTIDLVVSFGERISAKVVAECLSEGGMNAKAYNSYDIGFVTDSNFGNAEVFLEETEKNLQKFFREIKNSVPVVTGFIARNENGEITTLGRGGSDYTAAIIGAALNAEEIQIWTDADGIMTADPRIVKNAKTVDFVSYDEASELAFLGAKVLHPKTILPAVKKDIQVRILNTYNPNGRGTTVLKSVGNRKNSMTSIACKKGVKVINIHSTKMFLIHGFMAKIFDIFASLKIPVDMISTSEVNVSLTISGRYDTTKLMEELRKIAEVDMRDKRSSISVVGLGIRYTPGIAGKIFSALGNNNINVEMISLGASEINQSLVVKEEDADRTVRILHETFFGE